MRKSGTGGGNLLPPVWTLSARSIETPETRASTRRSFASEHDSEFINHTREFYPGDFALCHQAEHASADLCYVWFADRDRRVAHSDPYQNPEAQEAVETKIAAEFSRSGFARTGAGIQIRVNCKVVGPGRLHGCSSSECDGKYHEALGRKIRAKGLKS